jgi:hypothetical protein
MMDEVKYKCQRLKGERNVLQSDWRSKGTNESASERGKEGRTHGLKDEKIEPEKELLNDVEGMLCHINWTRKSRNERSIVRRRERLTQGFNDEGNGKKSRASEEGTEWMRQGLHEESGMDDNLRANDWARNVNMDRAIERRIEGMCWRMMDEVKYKCQRLEDERNVLQSDRRLKGTNDSAIEWRKEGISHRWKD